MLLRDTLVVNFDDYGAVFAVCRRGRPDQPELIASVGQSSIVHLVMCRVDGVELLEAALRRGKTGSDDDDSDEEDEDDMGGDAEAGGDWDASGSDAGAVSDAEGGSDVEAAPELTGEAESDSDGNQMEVSAEDDMEGSDGGSDGGTSEDGEEDESVADSEDENGGQEPKVQGRRRGHSNVKEVEPSKPKLDACTGSLKQLKQQVARAKAEKAQAACPAGGTLRASPDGGVQEDTEMPLEQMRILTQEDFERIRKLKV